MRTRFSEDVDRNCPLGEYPRPQMERDSWQCLNGEWDYAITGDTDEVAAWDGKILVPFSPETELSGVGRVLKTDEVLWYQRAFSYHREKEGERTLLHFGAVDQRAVVYLNGEEAGKHRGGYTAFTLEITDLLKEGENLLTVRVEDPLSKYGDARGKQAEKPGGIWYTSQSGIWQTVWTETVPEKYVSSLKIDPDLDAGKCRVTVVSETSEPVILNLGGVSYVGKTNVPVEMKPEKIRAWSPEDPYLYSFTVRMGDDEVRSYFGLRKFSVGKDGNGEPRLFLNGKPYFHNGLLDQGYWPDGLYTAPTDEAMIYDIEAMKAMGFNCLRKHIKIEPDRWYYHCDRLGSVAAYRKEWAS